MSRYDENRPLAMPAAPCHASIAKAAEKQAKMVAAHREADGRVEALAAGLRNAREADLTAASAAITAGKAAPAATAPRMEHDLGLAEKHAEATKHAVASARRALTDTIEANRDQWQAKCAERVDEARLALAGAVDELENRLVALGRAGSELSLVREWPDLGFKDRRLTALPGVEHTPGNPVALDALMAALRRLAAAPEPREVPEHVPPGGRQSGRLPRHGLPQREPVGGLHPTAQPSVSVDVG